MWGVSSCSDWVEPDHTPHPGSSNFDDVGGIEVKDTSSMNNLLAPNGPESNGCGPSSSKNLEADSTDESDFSDAILKFINQALMEDDSEDKVNMIQDSALHAAEKSFHDILAEKHPSSLTIPNQLLSCGNINSSDDMGVHSSSNYVSDKFLDANSLRKSGLTDSLSEYKLPHAQNSFVDHNFLFDLSLVRFPSSLCDTDDRLMGSVVDVPMQIGPVFQFKEEIGEPKAGLASDNCGCVDFDNVQSNPLGLSERVSRVEDKKEKDDNLPNDSVRGRKNIHLEENESEEGRSKKRVVACTFESVLLEMLDMMMLSDGENDRPAMFDPDKSKLNWKSVEVHENEQLKVPQIGRKSTKKQGSNREMVDMRGLLFQCAQTLTNNDLRSTKELLRQIRWHSSPFGDKFQRMSHYFANSFEARLAGTGYTVCRAVEAKRRSDINSLKAARHHVSVFPFLKMSNFFSTQMIMDLVAKASALHIINFDIVHGVFWPPLIQCLSKRVGGPPKLRITGLDSPQPGFQSAAMLEKTGRHLSHYCESLQVPFEYNFIAKRYENICVEDLKIEKDEVLVVASFYRFRDLLDESVSEDSPREAVLKLIRKICPDIFIHGIGNGAYNSPYLVSRFREAFFHFSAIFDMFEANMPQEDPERLLFEQEFPGREILNVIACEGSERIERPETYKQWHVRHLRAGFSQLPLNQEIMKKVTGMVKSNYHKGFFVKQNNQWFLQGWKGRVLVALSFWKPA